MYAAWNGTSRISPNTASSAASTHAFSGGCGWPRMSTSVAQEDVAQRGWMQRIDLRVLRGGEVVDVVALNRLVEERQPDQQHDREHSQRAAARVRRLPSQHRLARGGHLVHAAGARDVRRALAPAPDRPRPPWRSRSWRRRTGPARACSPSRSARSSARRGRSAGSSPCRGGSRSRSAAWRCRRCARRASPAASSLKTHLVHVGRVVRQVVVGLRAACGCSWR